MMLLFVKYVFAAMKKILILGFVLTYKILTDDL